MVYLEGEFPAPKGPLTAQMAQKNLAFVTPLLPVLVGTTVEFPNLDETYHNIFSYSKPKRFDLGRYRGEERPIPSQVFDKPGPVALHCDIHEHMFGIILVLTTPHFARTDAEGRYRLANLPRIAPGSRHTHAFPACTAQTGFGGQHFAELHDRHKGQDYQWKVEHDFHGADIAWS